MYFHAMSVCLLRKRESLVGNIMSTWYKVALKLAELVTSVGDTIIVQPY